MKLNEFRNIVYLQELLKWKNGPRYINESYLRYILRYNLRENSGHFLTMSFIQTISYAYLNSKVELDFLTVLWRKNENEIGRISLDH